MKQIMMVFLSVFALSMIGCAHGGHGHHHGKKSCCSKKKCAKWEKMDTNGDGAVSKSEWDIAGVKKFEAMDANKDGKVTKEEKMAWKKAKHAAKHGEKKKACCGN